MVRMHARFGGFRRSRAGALALILCLSLTSCLTATHTVGDGPGKGEVVERHAWYLLWGLVPLNPFDSAALAGRETSYRVQTGITVWDGFLSLLLAPLSLRRMTVRVEK